MKNLIITALLLCLGIVSSAKQSDKKLMAQIKSLRTCSQTSDFAKQTFEFSKLAKENPTKWLSHYYTSYSQVLLAYKLDNPTAIDSVLDCSQKSMEKAFGLDGDKSELYCIKSMISSCRILVNPAERGMEFGILSNQDLEQAALANKDNPRIYYLQALGKLYMPEEYGGGCRAAKTFLRQAISAYEDFKPKSKLYPNWGMEEADEHLVDCSR